MNLSSMLCFQSRRKGIRTGKFQSGERSNKLKILSYNVWFHEGLELYGRMKAIGDLIRVHSPDIICLQEITTNIYNIFQQSDWWKEYKFCSISSGDHANLHRYFCILISRIPIKSFSCMPFKNSMMGRELCMAKIELPQQNIPLIIATSHLESPCPAPPSFDQTFNEERTSQAIDAMNHLTGNGNVFWCGDMNWDEEIDGDFPLLEGWIDAWTELRLKENGWTFDTHSNPLLFGHRPLQKRLDRFVCKLNDFKLDRIDIIGTEEIPGLLYYNEVQKMKLPVLPSDHYGLLLEVHIK